MDQKLYLKAVDNFFLLVRSIEQETKKKILCKEALVDFENKIGYLRDNSDTIRHSRTNEAVQVSGIQDVLINGFESTDHPVEPMKNDAEGTTENITLRENHTENHP